MTSQEQLKIGLTLVIRVETDVEAETLIIDATAVPVSIAYPTDINLLNQAREKAEKIVDAVYGNLGEKKPRMYRENAHKDYLKMVRKKRLTPAKRRSGLRKQLNYLKRDFKYLDSKTLSDKQQVQIEFLNKLYDQQRYMYDHKTHRVPDRIVSLAQPFIRPIVRGKAKAKVEFGPKLDLVNESGVFHIAKYQYDPYNESSTLPLAVEDYKDRHGHYPKQVLADKLYQTRDNRMFCKNLGIKMSGPKLGRPRKDETIDKKAEYEADRKRTEIERDFSHLKRSFGLGLLRTKLEATQYCEVQIAIMCENIDRSIRCFCVKIWNTYKNGHFVEIPDKMAIIF
jgi:hypothetical protein